MADLLAALFGPEEGPVAPQLAAVAQPPEPATWKTEGGKGKELVTPACTLIHSRDSTTRVDGVFFRNDSHVPAMVVWRNHCGAEVEYGIVAPGQRIQLSQWTYSSHPWTARVHAAPPGAPPGLHSGSRLMLGPRESMVAFGDRPGDIVISAPPVLKWSRATHKHFPPAFKDAVKELLRAHHVVRRRARQAADPVHASPARSKASTPPRCFLWWPFDSSSSSSKRAAPCMQPLLDAISSDLLLHIIASMAPTVRQCVSHGAPSGHPDIQPALLPWDPTADPERRCPKCGGRHGGLQAAAA